MKLFSVVIGFIELVCIWSPYKELAVVNHVTENN